MSSDWMIAMRTLSAPKSTAIIGYPSGRFGLAGSIPIELTEVRRSWAYENRVSKVFASEQETIDALLALGITHFQRADCSWYDA